MIKLFVTDLDGCVSIPFKTPVWECITEIRNLNIQSADDPTIPPLSICSGRPYPYVEAVAQWLDVRLPVVFESGGMYDLNSNQFDQNGFFDEAALEHVNELKNWMRTTVISKFPNGIMEFSKMMDAGFVHPDESVINEVLPIVTDHVDENYPEFEVHHTDISVNIILKKNNKGAGIKKLSERLGITPKEVAYIGDSNGDIPAMEIVGQSFAPVNAKSYVREFADFPLDLEATEAVLETYQRIIESNRG
ncbi:HAD hydrolase family protein [Aliifodinibius sp. S!AR15-10]|uniref:HAD hydrolase family protein n=1 Tax=Aliifodinibius sp. S!AR15-10 TaxID=2950437 RepID=UPI002856E58F|nr:HAD hydrolase family protein [Aliifodinibius sp. S!AR15-10]MDR8390829.1 HAD hydrolase family protein [Aliifodinibius sp. S!AR15-10]